MTQPVPYGFEPTELGSGFGRAFCSVWLNRPTCRMGFHVAEQHVNPVGGLHSGAMATPGDTQLMVFGAGAEKRASHCPTISLSVDYPAPAAVAAEIEDRVTMVEQSHTMLSTQATMTVNADPVTRSRAIYRSKDQGD
ncbi:PaaI family thioesterase [Sphingomonas psychrolutea]|uniref:PaaI family thioesterase n=1 Tax=Sphingomonas psychrolutea TaxID=1259676 RepID=A0ABQ1GX47_9SPHN|nr:hypothetical protein [Sphingomonas psychrolutea]GGA51697.1 hypothetical protein GCM10011395_22540 [Sphingomonas psychrolutea]